MKRMIFRLLLICALGGVAATACMEDKGNYDYLDASQVMPVVIEGLEDVSVTANDVLRIVPDLKNADGGDYAYEWSARQDMMLVFDARKITLSNQRDLDIQMRLEPGKYALGLEVRDRKTGVYVFKEVTLTVTASVINDGWYVLKDMGEYADFDYIDTDGTLHPDVIFNLSVTENARPHGQAIQIAYQGAGYRHSVTNHDGSTEILDNMRVFHVVTTEDVRTYDANTMILLKDFDDQFYQTPPIRKPEAIGMPFYEYSPGDIYLVNDGVLYSICGMYENVGKYSAAKVGFYRMHKDMIIPAIEGMWGFDMQNSRFLFSTTADPGMTPTDDNDYIGIGVPFENMPYTMESLMFGTEYYFGATAIAIFKGKDEEKYYYADLYFSGTTYPFSSFHEIEARYRMPHCKVRTAPTAGSFVYFGDGNSLNVYYNSNIAQREVVLHEFPADETITWMRCYMDFNWNNYLSVLTNSAAGWKLYVFSVISYGNPEFYDNPEYVYSGSGFARHAILREDW